MVRIEWPEPSSAIFANNMVVQRDDNTVFLSFYQLAPPLIWSVEESEMEKKISELESIKARPVVSVAFPINKLSALVGALTQQLSTPEKVPTE